MTEKALPTFIQQINRVTDVEELQIYLDANISVYEDQLKSQNHVRLWSKVMNITPDEYIEHKQKIITVMKDAVNARMKAIKKK